MEKNNTVFYVICHECNHVWLLIYDENVTDEQIKQWGYKILSQHIEIHNNLKNKGKDNG